MDDVDFYHMTIWPKYKVSVQEIKAFLLFDILIEKVYF